MPLRAECVERPALCCVTDFLSTSDGLSLIEAFMRLRNGKLRRRVVKLVQEMAAMENADA